MEVVFLLLIVAGGLAALVFGILWIASMFIYLNQQPSVFARTAVLGVATIMMGTVGLDIAAERELETAEAEYEAEIGVLRDELFRLQLQMAELESENDALETAAAERNHLEEELEKAQLTAEAVEEEERQLENEVAGEEPAALASDGPAIVFRDFANCTELKAVYPGGVGQEHEAYQPAMDRDQDGWACE